MAGQYYAQSTITSTAAISVGFGFVAHQYRIDNLSTVQSVYVAFHGATATSGSFPISAGTGYEVTGSPSTGVSLAISTGSTSSENAGVLALI